MVRTVAKDHGDKRQHILTIAAKVFAREGIARASMNEVAQACGISKANIYHYYSGKDDLVFDILDSYLSELRDLICALDLRDLTPPEQLRALTRAFLLAYEGMDDQHKIQGEGLAVLAEDRQDVLKTYQRDMVRRVADVLRSCAPSVLGEDPEKCREVTMSVFGMLNWFYMWNPNADQELRVRYASTIADLTLNGVRPKPL